MNGDDQNPQQPPTQPQQPQQQWFKLQGDDQKWYTVQALNPDAARSRVDAYLDKIPSQQRYPDRYSKYGGHLTMSGALAFAGDWFERKKKEAELESLKETAKTGKEPDTRFLPSKAQLYDVGRAITRVGQGVTDPVNMGLGAAAMAFPPAAIPIGAYYAGKGAKGAYDVATSEGPMTPNKLEQLLQSGSMIAGGLAGVKGGIEESPAITNAIRKSAGKDVSRGLKIDAQAGYDVAQAKLRGTIEQLATKKNVATQDPEFGVYRKHIEEKLKPAMDQIVNDATQAGHRLDILQKSQDLAREEMSRPGAVQSDVGEMQQMMRNISNTYDPLTGQWRPINPKNMSPRDLHDLSIKLGGIAERTQNPAVNRFAIRMRNMVNEQLETVAPGVAALRRQEASAIRADKAATERYEGKVRGSLSDSIKSIWHSGAPGVIAFALMKEAGFGFLEAAAPAMALTYLNRLPWSATTKAMLKVRMAELLEKPSTAVTPIPRVVRPPQQGPTAGPAGGPVPPTGPGPVPPGPRALPPSPLGGQAGTPPVAPQTPQGGPMGQTATPPPSTPQGPTAAPQVPQVQAPQQVTSAPAAAAAKMAEMPVKTLAESKAAVAKMYPNATEAELSERAITHFADVRAQAQATRELGSPLHPNWMKRSQEIKDQIIGSETQKATPKGEAVPAKGLPKEPATTPSSYGPAKTDHFIENQGEVPKENLGFNFAPPEDLGNKVRQDPAGAFGKADKAAQKAAKEAEARQKVIVDTIGRLQEQIDNPKNAAQKVASQKKLDELKAAVEAKNIEEQKRILRTQRKTEATAARREKEISETTGAASTDVKAEKGDAPDFRTPEQHMIELDSVYKQIMASPHLPKGVDGKLFVEAMRRRIKQAGGGPEDELGQAQETLNRLNEIGRKGTEKK